MKVTDADSTGFLNMSIVRHSLVSNTESATHGGMFPFVLKYFEEQRAVASAASNKNSASGFNLPSSKSKSYRFQIKTNVYLKPSSKVITASSASSGGGDKSTTSSISSSSSGSWESTRGRQGGKNVLYQFNLSAWDENVLSADTAVVQIVLINRQQRVKLVFSQPIDRVVRFQDEFQAHISRLTGFKAFIDRVCLGLLSLSSFLFSARFKL